MEECNEMLYKNKQGKNIRVQTETSVLKVKNLGNYIQKIAESESSNLSHLSNGDELNLCYNADVGGGRFIAEFTFINEKMRK